MVKIRCPDCKEIIEPEQKDGKNICPKCNAVIYGELRPSPCSMCSACDGC
ncbi:MAG: hypothetical protein QF475_02600 [Candidatus Undinarchaeales archaeon]|jgi:Zn finger protein HypA/HybF involved in hydrogenase expression|nr:hypothetical protein [Candidatus Undinarchaeales archaeon]